MPKRHPRPFLFVVALSLAAALLPGAAFANKASDDTSKSTPTPATTGTVEADAKDELKKRLDDCMAVWDRKTHMTKQQWRRTCKDLLDEKL